MADRKSQIANRKSKYLQIRVLWFSIALLCLLPMAPLSAAPLSAAPRASGGDDFKADADIRFELISLEQGLSQSSVYCILQDSQGLMWFGTQDGLNKYDGYNFTVYKTIPGVNSLANNFVQALYEDHTGALWIGTNGGGLDRFDRETEQFVHYAYDTRNPHSLSGDVVHAIYEDRETVLWVGTDAGLSRYDRETDSWIRYRQRADDAHSLSQNTVWAIYEDQYGALWVGTSGGLNRFDRDTGHFIHYVHDYVDNHSLSSNLIWAIHEDEAGGLWIGTDNGLNRFYRETEQFVHYQNVIGDPYSLVNNAIHAIYQDREGDLWIGTIGGLDRFDRRSGRFIHHISDYRDPQSLSSNWIWSIAQDREGVLWIGTYGGGLNKFNRTIERFAHYYSDLYDAGDPGINQIWSIYKDGTGTLWIGTEGAGLGKFDRDTGKFRLYQNTPWNPQSLSHNSVRAILEDHNGVLWIGTSGGLDRLDRETGAFAHCRYIPDDAHSLSHNSILALYEDRAGVLWVGTQGGGLNRLDLARAQFTRYQADPEDSYSLLDNTVHVIYEDSQGALWVGTSRGLDRLDRESGRFYHYEANLRRVNSLSANTVMAIYEDATGILWIGTFGGGLNKFDRTTGTFTQYREQHGLPNDVVYGILDDGHYLWLSTNKGLSRFDPQSETFRNYNVHDGLQSNEFNAGASYQAEDGEMFFGGINGINAFYPDEIGYNRYVPPVVLTGLTQNGEPVDVGRALGYVDHVTFQWPNNFFEFEFAALSFAQPQKNQYAYRLENFDKEWNYVGTRRFGRYTNLPGGKYTLRIKGSNDDGVWNEEGVAVQVTIVPPIWQTRGFIVAVSLLLIATVVGGYRWRVGRIAVRNQELETQVAERTQSLAQRTHELEERNREIERRRQELEALYRADAELHRYLSLDQVLHALADIVVDILEADKSALLVWDEVRERLVVRVARGYHPETLPQMVFAQGEGTVGHVLGTGEPVIVADARVDPRVAKRAVTVEPEGICAFMQVPIRVGGEIFGVFSADYVQPRAFGEDEQRLFVALAQRAALAIDTAQLYEQSKELAVMEERNRLARDLHDAVTQTLFSASLIAEVLPTLWEVNQAEGRRLLKELRQMSRGAQAEMRTLLLELRPAALVETELGDLLRQLGEALTGREGIPVQVHAGEACELPPDVHFALYRIAQEALNNIAKHARATHVDVTLRCSPAGGVELSIVDDGCGFDLSQHPATSDPRSTTSPHFGLDIMRERAAAIGADFEVQSCPGQGTQVLVRYGNVDDAFELSLFPGLVGREQDAGGG